MSKQDGKNPWTLTNTHEEYRDFCLAIPDNENGVGGEIRITLVDEPDEEPYAYGSICIDTEDGEEIAAGIEFEITREQAELLLAGAVLAKAEEGRG